MSSSLNKVQIIGNLAADPEVKTFQNGGSVTNLRVAASERWKDKATGEWKERTEWVSVSIHNQRLGDYANDYLRKGNKVYVEGQLQTRKWTDQQGNERYSTELVISQFKGEIINLTERQKDSGKSSSKTSYNAPPSNDIEDHIPF